MKAGESKRGNRLRVQLTDSFLKDLMADYQQNGAGAIKIMRQEQPVKYCIMISSLLPKELSVDITENKLNELPTEQIDAAIDELTDALRRRTEPTPFPVEIRKGTTTH
jgi:hypothetical protein